MKQVLCTVKSNKKIAKYQFRMVLVPADSGTLAGRDRFAGFGTILPGTFIDIALPGRFLRRPVSVHDFTGDSLSIIYKVAGGGTDAMSHLRPGFQLDCLVGLGNGFDTRKAGKRPLLIGGGVGTPPLYLLAKELMKAEDEFHPAERDPLVLLGFNTAEEIICADAFLKLGADVQIATVDGSAGSKGFVTGLLPRAEGYWQPTSVYTCGPLPMLHAVYDAVDRMERESGIVVPAEFSFEARMGCGFGACMGCSIRTTGGYKRICKDGPILQKEEIVWEKA